MADADRQAGATPLTGAGPALPGATTVLRLPPRALLVVAGLPGAGKTALLSRLDAGTARVLDPEAARRRDERWLGRVPYRLWRPLVHGEHYLRLLLAMPEPSGLVVHDTGTRGWVRAALVAAARWHRRAACLLLLDVGAGEALAGQRRRHRPVPARRFARHRRRWLALRADLAASACRREGWAAAWLAGPDAIAGLAAVDIPDAAAGTVRRQSTGGRAEEEDG